MNLAFFESISIRKLIIVTIALPITLNLIFLNVFFAANREIKASHQWALHSKEVLSDSKFLVEHVNELSETAAENFNDLELKEKQNNSFLRLLNLLELKKDNLAGKLEESSDATRQIKKIGEAINDLKSLPPISSSKAKSDIILKSIRESVISLLESEKELDELRTLKARSSIDFEYNLVIYSLFITIIYYLCIIYILKRSFFLTLDRIMNNLSLANNGSPLLTPPKLNSELSMLENEFYYLYKKLEERSHENEGFIYCVSHDLRSPLLNIQAFSKELIKSAENTKQELLKSQSEITPSMEGLLSESKDSLNFILASVGKLTQIIESVLSLSRAGRIPIKLEIIDLNVKMDSILKSIESLIRESNCSITVQKLPEVCGDRVALNQIFLNLITNSIKYRSQDRALRIEIGEDKEKSNSYYKAIYVKDNAIGIPQDALEKIFLPFEQIKDRKVAGEGLGLSIVKKLIERIGGRVTVESTEEVGTKFTIYLKPDCPTNI